LKKRTQNGPRHVYQFVPIQDFSIKWTDQMLYTKYKLSSDEIEFIEKMIRPMVLANE
jgi:site-specific DNA-methyltransferase (adenine-specific)